MKLLADRKLRTQVELHFSKSRNADNLFKDPIENNQNYKKAVRFADGDLKRESINHPKDAMQQFEALQKAYCGT